LSPSPRESLESPRTLQVVVPWEWILVVSRLGRCRPETLTPRLFRLTLAKRGGYIGRKSDGPPGRQTIWRGWSKVVSLREGVEVHRELLLEKSYG
jgi:hypothetical protein